MKFPNSIFLSHGKKRAGATLTRDGEMDFPPLLNLAVTIGGPIDSTQVVVPADSPTVPPATSQSVMASKFISAVDVVAGFNQGIATLNHGMWIIDWFWTWQFTGTAGIGTKRSTFNLNGPNGLTWSMDSSTLFQTPMSYSNRGRFIVDLMHADLTVSSVDNWQLVVATPTTVAGDIWKCLAGVIAQPIISQ